MKQIKVVAWAVPPGPRKNTRPSQLVAELQALGIVGEGTEFRFHGRSRSTTEARSAGVLLPSSALSKDRSVAVVLSPVFGRRAVREAIWVDFYDDWSLAPDINRWHRHLAASAYRAAIEGVAGRVTVNSVYMALRTGTPLAHVVPNGVDPALGHVVTTGDDKRRLIVLGHFFKGRTDFDALRTMLMSGLFDEIVVGGAGNDTTMLALIDDVGKSFPNVVRVVDWLGESDLAALVGKRTVAFIPHVVSDYTLSQDMMKVYTYLALGMRVVCPRLLWPAHLSPEFALLYDFGMSFVDAIPEWIEEPPPSEAWRVAFGEKNSWRKRALRIAEIIEESNA